MIKLGSAPICCSETGACSWGQGSASRAWPRRSGRTSLARVIPIVAGVLVPSCGNGGASRGVVTDAQDVDATSDAFEDGSPQDGPTVVIAPGSDAAPYFGRIILRNDLCFARALPADQSSGMSKCRLLLAGVTAGCGQPGLQPASGADLASYDKWIAVGVDEYGVQPPQGSLCSVTQIASLAGMSCANDVSPGWCYVRGSCQSDAGPTCRQDVCVSEGLTGEQIAYALTVLACD